MITSCQSLQEVNEYFALKGKIIDFKGDADNTIEFNYSIYGNREFESVLINNNGEFEIKLPLPHPINCQIKHNQKSLQVFCEPGDNLYLEINPDSFPDKTKFQGKNADFNKYYLQFQKESRSYLRNYLVEIDSIKEVAPQRLKDFVFAYKNENQDYVNQFSFSSNCSNQFKDWSLNYLNYEISHDLIFNDNVQGSDYYEFFDDFEVDNKHAIGVSTYWDYLQGYIVYLLNIKNTLNPESSNLELAQIIADNATGYGRDYLLAHFFLYSIDHAHFSIEEMKEATPVYLANIKSKQVRTYLENYSKDFIEGYDENDLRLKSKTFTEFDNLKEIMNKYSGSYVYVKIWADWCGPCIKSMPDFKSLSEYFKERNIRFILLTIDSNEKRTNDILSFHNIQSENYILDKNATEEIKNKLMIDGIPHYFMLDKNGDVLLNDVDNPKSLRIKDIINQVVE